MEFLIALLGLAIISLFTLRVDKPEQVGNICEYRYPPFLSVLCFSGIPIFVFLIWLGFVRTDWSSFKLSSFHLAVLISFPSLCIFGGFYFRKTVLILSPKKLKKNSIFNKKVFLISQIEEIVIHENRDDSGTAMARVYCKGEKMTLESFLVGYEELLVELIAKCKHANVKYL